MEDVGGASQVRKVEREHLDAGEGLPKGIDPGVVRPVAASDDKRPLVEPERVAALGRRRCLEVRGNRDAGLDEVDGHRAHFRSPPFLAGPQEDRPLVGHEGRIVDVDLVRANSERGLARQDLGARFLEKEAERFVLGGEADGIRLGPPAVGPPSGAVGRPRRPNEHALKRPGHALAAVNPGVGNLHRVDTTARLSGLEAGGGCAAKYAAARLEELLAGFAPASSENLLVGLAPADDAAVYRLDDERALIFTVDFFPPMLDDPVLYGAIAAANALNDVFAMGGKPLLALSIAAFPEELGVATVRAIFDAAAEKVQEAGAILAGGHTIRDDEPKYGLAVVGTVRPDAVWRKSAARPGDALFLTKPLGTGLVLTGVRKGILGAEELREAGRWMTELNDRAADALRPFEPNAVTDVTGFGLFGHASEVAERSAVRLVLEASRFPVMNGADAVAAHGLKTGGDSRNREFASPSLELDGLPDPLAVVGFDPQTAGGLLFSIPDERSVVLEAEFRARGVFLARVGRVEEGRGVAVL